MKRRIVSLLLCLALIMSVVSASTTALAYPPASSVVTSNCGGGCVGMSACAVYFLICVAQVVNAEFLLDISFVW